MFDRAPFWSSVPEWSQAAIASERLRITLRSHAVQWLVSGNTGAFLARHGVARTLGPRDCSDVATIALRLAPDRVLFVGDSALAAESGWTAEGCAISDMSDGLLCIELSGAGAADVLAVGSEYPFASPPGPVQESAQMLFAGLRVIVARRAQAWWLFVERPWGAALWRWLERNQE